MQDFGPGGSEKRVGSAECVESSNGEIPIYLHAYTRIGESTASSDGWVGAAHSLLYECDENISAVFGEVALSGEVCECQNWTIHLMNWLEALVFTLRERRILQSVMRDTHASHDAPSGAQPAPGSHSAAGQCALPHTPAAPPHLRGEMSQQTTPTLVTNTYIL